MLRGMCFRSAIASLLVGSSILATTGESWAELAPSTGGKTVAPAPAAPAMVSRWYGWQILIVDGASTVMLFSDALGLPVLTLGGLATYVVGGPSVHLLHEQWWKAAVSGA